MAALNQFPEYREFRSGGSRTATDSETRSIDDDAPEEAVERAYQQLTAALAEELLDKMLEAEPEFFEQLVVDVLVAMGYGGSKAEAGERLGRAGDEGLDGVIRGTASAWTRSTSRPSVGTLPGRSAPDVQAFAGAIRGARASKGVFITTSAFSQQAKDFADSISARVVLTDGRQLARLMIEHGVGVTVGHNYHLKRLDEGYFTTDRT